MRAAVAALQLYFKVGGLFGYGDLLIGTSSLYVLSRVMVKREVLVVSTWGTGDLWERLFQEIEKLEGLGARVRFMHVARRTRRKMPVTLGERRRAFRNFSSWKGFRRECCEAEAVARWDEQREGGWETEFADMVSPVFPKREESGD